MKAKTKHRPWKPLRRKRLMEIRDGANYSPAEIYEMVSELLDFRLERVVNAGMGKIRGRVTEWLTAEVVRLTAEKAELESRLEKGMW